MPDNELILFTNSFPYGNGETFLETEILYLSLSFSKIHILPLYWDLSGNVRQLPDNVTYSSAFLPFNVVAERRKLLSSGMFNIGPLRLILFEFFKKRVYLKNSHLKNWASASCILRALLSGKNKKTIFSKISPNSKLYFYWGDKSTVIVPFLHKNFPNPIVSRFHNSDLYEEIKDGYIPFRDILLKNLSESVFIAQKGETYMTKLYPNLEFSHKLFRLGVNNFGKSERSKDDKFRIVSCSYLVPIKRIHLIIEALKLLDLEIEWTHLGGGILLNELQDQSDKLGKNIKSRFYGHITNQEVLKYYRKNSVDLFINVSESEGIPVSIMEVISAGIPVIATDVGGTSEIVQAEFGKLIPKDFNVRELSYAIQEIYSKKEHEIEQIKEDARSFWSDNFNAEKNYTLFSKYIASI